MSTEKLIDDAVTAFTDREIPAPSRDHLRIALNAFEASLTRCGCADCTTARREHTGITDHDRTALARVLHELVYSPGANYDRAVPDVQEYMLACAEKVAAALPWMVPGPEVTLEVGEVPDLRVQRVLELVRSSTGELATRVEILLTEDTAAPWEAPDGCFGHCDPEGWHRPCRDGEPQGEPSDARIRQAVLDGLAEASVLQSPFQPQTRELVVEQITLALRAAEGVR